MSRSQRYRAIVTILMEEGFGTAADQLGLRVSWVNALRSREIREAESVYSPEQRARRAIERLGPTFSKIGQMLSVRPDLIPPSFAAEFAKLQDEMEPFPFEQAKEEIEREFGEPLKNLFAEFDETPFAAATIGQVYRATLDDDDRTPVVVKVQRPDIHQVIDADLDILRTQARRITGRTDLGRRYDIAGIVDEFAKAIREECDYVREGENCERLAAMFAEDTTVQFPRVYWERSTETVLTLERIDGVPFNKPEELDRLGVNRHEAARRGITCYYEQIFIHGFYHADPHPGNLFAMPDGRVAFTDFGRAGELTDRARTLVADLLVAIIEQNGSAAVDVLMEVSTGAADVDVAGLKRDVTTLISKYYDLKLHEVDSKDLIIEIMSLIGKRGLTLSSEFALLLTTLATIQGLGTFVDPEFHFVESVQPFAARIVEEQFKPSNVIKNLGASIRGNIKAMQGFPENLNRTVKRIGDGDLRVNIRPTGVDPLMARVEQAVDRIAFAMVVSAFVIGFSWLLARTEIPWWVELIADFALVCAAGVGVFFFMSIIWRIFRHRKHE